METIVLPSKGARTLEKIDPTIDVFAEIERLRREKNAVILAHYYQDAEIQDLADFIGDSLDLSRKAAETKADVIAFCGVRFMAEVAKILSPDKTVLLPDEEAGCSLEDSCKAEELKKYRDAHPDTIIVTYINSSAAVKALSDVIVTSSSAEHIVRQLPADKPIMFAPDQHLGRYVARVTGRKMELWNGSCIVHDRFSARELSKLKTKHPKAPVVAHPECTESILSFADHVGSTRAILDYVVQRPEKEFIIATERHIIHQMEKLAPGKTFIPAPGSDGSCNCASCPYMALNTVEKLHLALVNMAPRVEIPEALRVQAHKPLKRMLEMTSATKPARAAE
jgi:quinolinate synthase